METSTVKRPGQRAILFLAALVVIAVAVWGFSRWGQEPAGATGGARAGGARGPVVIVEKAARAPISRTLELTGSVEAVRFALLASPAEGPVQDLGVLEGDTVRPGALLLTIGRRGAADASLAYAREAERREAEELRRVEELVGMGALPSEELDQARVNYEQARAQLQQAEQLSGDYQVLAPWSGVVSKVHVHDGNYVAPRAPLVQIFDPGSLVVRVAVPEAGAAVVREGTKARVVLDAYPGQELEGRISRVYPELDRQTRTRTVEVEVSGAELAPGMFARVSFELEHAPEAVVVSDAAVVATAEGGLVAFVVQDSTVTRRDVTVGMEAERRLQVLSGIEAGELVVVSGQRNLREGMAVSPRRQTGQGGGP